MNSEQQSYSTLEIIEPDIVQNRRRAYWRANVRLISMQCK